jgi:hypothetical protein
MKATKYLLGIALKSVKLIHENMLNNSSATLKELAYAVLRAFGFQRTESIQLVGVLDGDEVLRGCFEPTSLSGLVSESGVGLFLFLLFGDGPAGHGVGS